MSCFDFKISNNHRKSTKTASTRGKLLMTTSDNFDIAPVAKYHHIRVTLDTNFVLKMLQTDFWSSPSHNDAFSFPAASGLWYNALRAWITVSKVGCDSINAVSDGEFRKQSWQLNPFIARVQLNYHSMDDFAADSFQHLWFMLPPNQEVIFGQSLKELKHGFWRFTNCWSGLRFN